VGSAEVSLEPIHHLERRMARELEALDADVRPPQHA
jgi:hypothetical protein